MRDLIRSDRPALGDVHVGFVIDVLDGMMRHTEANHQPGGAIAVLDVGKTNLKLAVFRAGELVWQTTAPNRPLPGPPYPHCDVAGIEAFALAALRAAAADHAIDTLVVTTHGATAALLAGDGALALPVMDYEFTGVDDIGERYAGLRPPFPETFTSPQGAGLIVARQLVWQQTHLPEAFARARHLVAYPQYFAFRFSGGLVSELTTLGCHTDLWDIPAGRPSSLARERGFDRLMPPVRRAFDVAGTLKPEIAAATGLPARVRVLVGIHDSNASILPHFGDAAPPFTVVSTGTWVVIMAVGGDIARLDGARDMLANIDATGRPLPTAKFMGGREVALILDGGSPECDEADVVAVLEAGSMALPCFVAGSGPFPRRAGGLVGPPPGSARARAAVAALYAALMADTQLTLLGATRGPLLIEGSFAGNRCFAAALAALRPSQAVIASGDTAGTAFGASLLALWPDLPRRPPGLAIPPLRATALIDSYAARWRAAVAT